MNSYSQHGEDKWISNNIPMPKNGVFVEVGAFDGVLSSNTLAFEELGWTGLLVEPDRENAAKCLINRKAEVACCAVGNKSGIHQFFVNHADKGLSGLERDGVPVKTTVIRLHELLNLFCIPSVDLLSIDTEGTELDVWESLISWRYVFPKVVIMEYSTLGLPPKHAEIISRMSLNDYSVVHKTDCNLIFVR